MALFVKLDTTWPDHPKLLRAGMDGTGLHAVALCLAKRLETDGWIDRLLLVRYGATDDLIDRLVGLSLFEEDGGRVRPWGWHRRNPSQAAIDCDRSAKAEAAKRGNHKRWKHEGEFADCSICSPETAGDRKVRSGGETGATRVRSPESETESETDTTPGFIGTNTYGVGPVDNGAAVDNSDPVDAMALAGRKLQALRSGQGLADRTEPGQVGSGDKAVSL